MKTFQIILLAIFGLLAVAGVLVFANITNFGNKTSIGEVVIWGTLDKNIMDTLLEEVRGERNDFDLVQYEQLDSRTYTEVLLDALASGRGPDLFLLPHEYIASFEDKVAVIPFESFSERDFKDIFIEEGELYFVRTAATEGSIGLPFLVDPLIMYWNRTLFGGAGFSMPPETWEQFFSISEKITKRDNAGNIRKSAVAFGETTNVMHAKEILSLLMLQAGDPITVRDNEGAVDVVFGEAESASGIVAGDALRFYTSFSNPALAVYSWNKSLPTSRDAFIRGDLAVYFGFASELPLIRTANPNLNFDIALIPQPQNSQEPKTFGKMQALAIPRVSRDTNAALRAATVLTEEDTIAKLFRIAGSPPVRRDVLSDSPRENAISPVFLDSALLAAGWLDPDPIASDAIFANMVGDITSGRLRPSEAIRFAQRELAGLVGISR